MQMNCMDPSCQTHVSVISREQLRYLAGLPRDFEMEVQLNQKTLFAFPDS